MKVSRAYIERFAEYLETVNAAAKKTIVTLDKKRHFVELLSEKGDLGRDEIAQAISEVCGTYHQLASALTCEFYNGIRQAEVLPATFDATVWQGYDKQEVLRAVNAVCDEVRQGRNTKPLVDLLSDIAARENRKSHEGTVKYNASRDPAKPRYAIVPNGDACAFCIMRASNGYTYPDKVQGIKSHSHCTCVATPVFGKSKVQGYDPSAYLDKYNEAAEALRNGDISDELKSRIAHQEEMKGKDFDRTNAVLMVMREQQGIK